MTAKRAKFSLTQCIDSVRVTLLINYSFTCEKGRGKGIVHDERILSLAHEDEVKAERFTAAATETLLEYTRPPGLLRTPKEFVFAEK